jgi:hypothetical protein
MSCTHSQILYSTTNAGYYKKDSKLIKGVVATFYRTAVLTKRLQRDARFVINIWISRQLFPGVYASLDISLQDMQLDDKTSSGNTAPEGQTDA